MIKRKGKRQLPTSRNAYIGAWTTEEDEMLRSSWARGVSASDIVFLMGTERTRNAIIGRAHRLRLAKRASPIRR